MSKQIGKIAIIGDLLLVDEYGNIEPGQENANVFFYEIPVYESMEDNNISVNCCKLIKGLSDEVCERILNKIKENIEYGVYK